jgi:putative flippase GtrA
MRAASKYFFVGGASAVLEWSIFAFFLYVLDQHFVSAIGIGFNLGILALGIDLLGSHEMVAKVCATAMVFSWNFVTRYYFVFRK